MNLELDGVGPLNEVNEGPKRTGDCGRAFSLKLSASQLHGVQLTEFQGGGGRSE